MCLVDLAHSFNELQKISRLTAVILYSLSLESARFNVYSVRLSYACMFLYSIDVQGLKGKNTIVSILHALHAVEGCVMTKSYMTLLRTAASLYLRGIGIIGRIRYHVVRP